jgi:REP element-mobilizing transposase RayT
MEVLEPGCYYHIFNRGINSTNLFIGGNDCTHFLSLYKKFIDPIADTFAYCLMSNHFHLLARIKEDVVYKYSSADSSIDAKRFKEVKWETISRFEVATSDYSLRKIPDPSKHFSHLFNAYTSYFNKLYFRTGSLFERPFKRIRVESESYLRYLVYYIHHNPVKHGFVDDICKYPWSSYQEIVSPNQTSIKRQEVIEWFGDLANFKYFHQQEQDLDRIKDLI